MFTLPNKLGKIALDVSISRKEVLAVQDTNQEELNVERGMMCSTACSHEEVLEGEKSHGSDEFRREESNLGLSVINDDRRTAIEADGVPHTTPNVILLAGCLFERTSRRQRDEPLRRQGREVKNQGRGFQSNVKRGVEPERPAERTTALRTPHAIIAVLG
ncbi:hypothetical protein B0H12DRAFT_1070763 [Mycena haematopus]|nr:hypothetical protein B0H12DRAFT_1070763 [Mycena haematopus]